MVAEAGSSANSDVYVALELASAEAIAVGA